MNTFDFEWKPEYRGTWKCPSCGNEIWGTLKMGQSDIVLELMYPSYHSLDDAQIESIIGKVDSEDANNLLHVKLGNLSLTKRKESLAQGFNP